jgi:hypothetical protein
MVWPQEIVGNPLHTRGRSSSRKKQNEHMTNVKRLIIGFRPPHKPLPARLVQIVWYAGVLLAALAPQTTWASENVVQRPFGYWADVPAEGQFVLGAVYEQAKSYHIWASGKQYNIKVLSGGENYGIDVRQGYFALQYGITEKWAADLEFGGTTVGWRSFSPSNSVQSTIGLMDTSFGVRYQIYNEADYTNSWMPTLTFRAGAVLPGSYNQDLAFAPGFRSTAIEPELLMRKHFGWPGFGTYADALYRYNMTTENDNYMVAFGFFQQIKGWELDAGYLHLQTTSGSDITFSNPNDLSTINYPRQVREIYDSIQAGFSYTTSKRHWKYGFHSKIVFDGNNSDRKPWFGGSIDIPFGGKKKD